MDFQSVFYENNDRVATVTLNRPEHLNAINTHMPGEIVTAVERTNEDDSVHIIVLTGAGRGFCSGYDLKIFAESAGEQSGSQLVLIRTGLGIPCVIII